MKVSTELKKKAAKQEGIKIGEARGEARGEAKERKNLIENMFKNNIDISLISKVTSVPIKKLQKIKTDLFL